MGFRCPKCHKDFGIDKKSLEEHVMQCAGIALNALVEEIDANTEEVTQVTVINGIIADINGKIADMEGEE